MKRIARWRDAFKWNSMRVLALIATLPVLWEQVPYEVKALIPAQYNPWIITTMALIGMYVRNTKQPNL